MQSFTLTIPMEHTLSNNRDNPTWLKQKVKAALSELTRAAATNIQPVERATIYIGITKRTHGKYDPVNLSNTFKSVIDTLVKMGAFPDDDYTHVIGPWCYHAGVDKRIPERHMRAKIIIGPYQEILF